MLAKLKGFNVILITAAVNILYIVFLMKFYIYTLNWFDIKQTLKD